MQVFLRHIEDPEHAGIGEVEAEHQLAAALRLALDREGHFEFIFGDVVGTDVDLDIDCRLLLLRRQRGRSVRVFERKILGVLRQHVQLGRRGRLGRRAVTVGHQSLSWNVLSERAGLRPNSPISYEKALSGRVAIIASPPSTRTTIAPDWPGYDLRDGKKGPRPTIKPGQAPNAYSKLLNMRDF